MPSKAVAECSLSSIKKAIRVGLERVQPESHPLSNLLHSLSLSEITSEPRLASPKPCKTESQGF
jgi:hypothetical protein